ncbi:MAG: hypothetical protein U1E65_17740 [Myxococcota bacterium]
MATPDAGTPAPRLDGANVWTTPPIDYLFGPHWIGTDSVRRLWLYSDQEVTLRLIGGAQAGFAVEGLSATGELQLAPSKAAPVVVRFSPGVPGYVESTIQFAVGELGRVVEIRASGEGIANPLLCRPRDLGQPSWDANHHGQAALTVICENLTLDPLSILDFEVAGAGELVETVSSTATIRRGTLGGRDTLPLSLLFHSQRARTEQLTIRVSIERADHTTVYVERPLTAVDWGSVPIDGATEQVVSFELGLNPQSQGAVLPGFYVTRAPVGAPSLEVLAYPETSTGTVRLRFTPHGRQLGFGLVELFNGQDNGFVAAIGFGG